VLIGLVRDVLDTQLVARDGARIGKVDDIVLRVSSDGTDVVAIECGGLAPARRLGWPLRPIMEWAARRWGVRQGKPYAIAWEQIREVGRDVEVDIDPDDTPARVWERRARRVVDRIPGAGRTWNVERGTWKRR
jgi:sporulation protein YlmC with PRC-barrel domain